MLHTLTNSYGDIKSLECSIESLKYYADCYHSPIIQIRSTEPGGKTFLGVVLDQKFLEAQDDFNRRFELRRPFEEFYLATFSNTGLEDEYKQNEASIGVKEAGILYGYEITPLIGQYGNLIAPRPREIGWSYITITTGYLVMLTRPVDYDTVIDTEAINAWSATESIVIYWPTDYRTGKKS